MSQKIASIQDVCDILHHLPDPDPAARQAAGQRNAHLTKPPGALGRLEDLAIWYCAWRGDPRARVARPQVIVFAGNHGVAAQGVSAFPAEVTAQMVENYRIGGAAINQIAGCFGADLSVRPIHLETPSRDFTQGPAMDPDDFAGALEIGWQSVDPQADLLVVGEMGIGNTTCAAAMAMALYGGEATFWTGAGTGLSGAALAHKASVVARGVAANPSARGNGLEALRCLGGYEIAAMAGALIRARTERIPVILDGVICTAAAACLEQTRPGALDHCVAGHLSAEGAHGHLLQQLGKEPILSLGLRLGEASGGALAIGILQGALACHSGMASFAEAGVSQG